MDVNEELKFNIVEMQKMGGGGGGGGLVRPGMGGRWVGSLLTLILSEKLHLQCLKYKKGNNSKIIEHFFFQKISPNTSLIIPIS